MLAPDEDFLPPVSSFAKHSYEDDGTDKQKDWYEKHTPDGETDMQEQLIDWNNMFRRHGPRVSLEKTEVMWVGQSRKQLEIHMDGKKLKQRDTFVYLGGAICGDGNSDTEIHRRITRRGKRLQKGQTLGGKSKR